MDRREHVWWRIKLTLTSTRLRLPLLEAKGLILRPIVREGERRRWIYVTPEVSARLENDEEVFPRASAEALFARFSLGHYVTVSREFEERADLKKMVGPDDVWVLCFRNPRPGGRLLGRFYEQDVFIGFALHTREELGGDSYTEKAAEVIAAWNGLLPVSNPVRSGDLADYVSPHFKDMDVDDD